MHNTYRPFIYLDSSDLIQIVDNLNTPESKEKIAILRQLKSSGYPLALSVVQFAELMPRSARPRNNRDPATSRLPFLSEFLSDYKLLAPSKLLEAEVQRLSLSDKPSIFTQALTPQEFIGQTLKSDSTYELNDEKVVEAVGYALQLNGFNTREREEHLSRVRKKGSELNKLLKKTAAAFKVSSSSPVELGGGAEISHAQKLIFNIPKFASALKKGDFLAAEALYSLSQAHLSQQSPIFGLSRLVAPSGAAQALMKSVLTSARGKVHPVNLEAKLKLMAQTEKMREMATFLCAMAATQLTDGKLTLDELSGLNLSKETPGLYALSYAIAHMATAQLFPSFLQCKPETSFVTDILHLAYAPYSALFSGDAEFANIAQRCVSSAATIVGTREMPLLKGLKLLEHNL